MQLGGLVRIVPIGQQSTLRVMPPGAAFQGESVIGAVRGQRTERRAGKIGRR